jgi:hypothetical protein
MAGTRQSGIERGRRWAVAATGGVAALALSVGLGNPWTAGTISKLSRDQGFDRVAPLAHSALLLRWSTTPGGALGANHIAWYAGSLTLDLGWPLLLLLALRALSAGLLARRGGFPLLLAAWALTGFTAALAALAGGAVQSAVAGGGRLPQNAGVLVLLPGTPSLGAVLTIQAASLALLGLAVGWLPALFALFGYVVGRLPEWDLDTGEEDTMVDLAGRKRAASTPSERETLNLAGLEALRNARYSYDPDPDVPGRLPDPRTSTFFSDGQY